MALPKSPALRPQTPAQSYRDRAVDRAAGFGLTWLLLILTVLVVKGVGGLNLAVFTEMTPPPGGTAAC